MSKISEHLKKINKFSASLYKNTWKSGQIPKQQLLLVDKAISDFKSGNGFELFDVLVRLIRNKIPLGSSILEIGCSSGYHNEVFDIAGLQLKYQGCDYSNEFIKMAKNKYSNINFKVCDAQKLNYKDKEFETTMLGGVLLHVKNWKKAIKEACRVSNKYLLIHRNPTLHIDKTTFMLKNGYGLKMFEIFFNESELFEEIYKNGFLIASVSVYGKSEIEGFDEPIFIKSYLCVKSVSN